MKKKETFTKQTQEMTATASCVHPSSLPQEIQFQVSFFINSRTTHFKNDQFLLPKMESYHLRNYKNSNFLYKYRKKEKENFE